MFYLMNVHLFCLVKERMAVHGRASQNCTPQYVCLVYFWYCLAFLVLFLIPRAALITTTTKLLYICLDLLLSKCKVKYGIIYILVL